MQEQPQYKITPEQGWARMAFVLDSEMPVLRRSRRVIIFWWSAAAVIAAFMLSLFVLLSEDKMLSPAIAQQTTTTTEEKQIIQSSHDEISSLSTVEQTDLQEPSHKTEPSTKNTTSTIPVRKQQSQTSVTKSNLNKSQDNTFANLDKNQNELFTEPIVNETLSGINQDIKQAELAQAHESITTPSEELIADRSIEVVEFLPLAGQALYDPNDPLVSLIEPITPFIQRRPLLAPHVSIGLMEGYFDGLGVHAGAGLAVNVMPRLSLTTEVGYNIYKPDVGFLGSSNKVREHADIDNILREDINSNGIGTYLPADVVNNSAGSVISPFIQTIMQWQVSAGLKYKLSKKFFAEAGGSYMFGTTSSSMYPIAEVDYGNATGFHNVSNSFDSYKVLKSNSTMVYAGLGYKPGEKWEFNVSWNHAIDPYLVNNPVPTSAFADRTDYIRGLNVGLKYLL